MRASWLIDLRNLRKKCRSLMYDFRCITNSVSNFSMSSLSFFVRDIGPAIIGLPFKSSGISIWMYFELLFFILFLIMLLLWIFGCTEN